MAVKAATLVAQRYLSRGKPHPLWGLRDGLDRTLTIYQHKRSSFVIAHSWLDGENSGYHSRLEKCHLLTSLRWLVEGAVGYLLTRLDTDHAATRCCAPPVEVRGGADSPALRAGLRTGQAGGSVGMVPFLECVSGYGQKADPSLRS